MLLDDSDREQLFTRLKASAAAGALSVEELERRVEVVARARTREEAVAAVADLPPELGEHGDAASRPSVGRRRGHGHADRPGPDWRATSERFRDPRSGQVMRVWEDPAGQRHYVPEQS
ncbi:MAG TPA: DUF1707 domain-containing protein [Solirubrobacteraceae bacterium]